MGIISTMTRRMRNNRLSKRLSISSTKPEEDSNDLIKTTWETASLTRPSVESTSTIVRHSQYDAVLPSESTNRLQIRTDNMNMRTLFDQTPISPTDRAKQALSSSEYPIFKLDMCEAPFQAPKVLQEPLETRDWRNKSTSIKNGVHGSSDCSSTSTKKYVPKKNKNRRSVAGLWKKHCGLTISRSSLSFKADSTSPKWLDSAGLGEDEGLVDMKNEKLLEVHLQNGKRNSIWGGGLRGRW
jgi:hypothetical protein